MSVAKESRAYPSAPNAEPITSATFASTQGAVRQKAVESEIRFPPRVRPKWAETFMNA